MSTPSSFYCRDLPGDLIDYRSSESKLRLARCLLDGTAVPFLTLSSCFNSQAEPAYCGLSTLAIILNALRIDPQRIWKTPWRWFTEDLLDCCRPLEVVKKVGITMEEFLCLAKCNGAACTITRPDESDESYELFKKAVICVCTGGAKAQRSLSEESSCRITQNLCYPEQNGQGSKVDEENPNELIAISYSRAALKQTGSGHFSPIAAYDPETDSALVLDTARFKYPPYWVPMKSLFSSLLPIDPTTGKCRGYFVLRARNDVQGKRVCCLWQELLASTPSHNGMLPEPHPMYDKSITCYKDVCQGKDKACPGMDKCHTLEM